MSVAIPPTHDPAAIRRTILILSVCGFASALSSRFVDPLIGVIARDLDADPLRVALLSSAYTLPYAFIQPILGPVGDAYGKELVSKVLIVSLTLVLAAASVMGDLNSLFVARVLSGAAAGGIIPMALATIGDRVAMAERQVAIGRFLTATISGQLLGGFASGLLAPYLGWRGVFVAAAACSAVAAIAVLLGFRNSARTSGALTVRGAIERYAGLLRNSRARALMAFVFAEGIVVFGVLPYIAPLLEASGEGGPTQAGLIIAGFAIGGIIYTLVVGWLLSTLGLGLMLRVAGVLVALGFGALVQALPWTAEIGAMLVIGLGFYMLHNTFQTQMTEVAPEARGSAIALHAFSFFVGQSLGPILMGTLLSSAGRPVAMAFCALAGLALGLVASASYGERQPRAR